MQTLRSCAALTAVPVAVLGAAAALAWGSAGTLGAVTAAGPATLEDLLAVCAAVAAWVVFGWLAIGLLLTVTAGMIGPAGALDRVALAITPQAVRRLAALMLGLGLVGAPVALALPAQAGPIVAAARAQPGTEPQPSVAVPALERWTPDRPALLPPAAAPATEPLALLVSRPHRERAATDHVVVRRGDTLWDIAARALRPDASAAEIAASWPRWHAANATTIGPDPDLIRPGQLLRPPGS